MSTLTIETAKVFAPLLEPARYKGAHGGRGSGKSHFFAGLGVEDALRYPGDHGEGLRMVCIREVQKSLKESAKRLLEDKLNEYGLGARDGFKVWKESIETPGDGVIIFQGMQDATAENVKSFEGFHRAWAEEAQTLSERSLALLRPTIRADASELWFSWNPRRATDPVDQLLRNDPRPTDAVVVSANWYNNPWFPAVLEQERTDCLANEPDQYDHVWDGGYASVLRGAYYAQSLQAAKEQGRITPLALDPLMGVCAYWDIGGTGARADATAIWVAQHVGGQIRVLDYYEAQGQPLSTHVEWLRANGYGNARCILPHDGAAHDKVHQVSFESALRQAGFAVEIVPNQGAGAARKRIEAARRRFPAIWFDRDKTEPGRAALGWYHERHDETRNIGLGPEHDWSSHGADAFGLMCVHYREPKTKRTMRAPQISMV